MSLGTNRPIEEIRPDRYQDLLRSKEIRLSDHALDRLSERQRETFDVNILTSLCRKKPSKAYLQKNGRYRCYYRQKQGYKKIIIDINNRRATIITFMNVDQLPRIKL